jgi:hypothetical protein
MEVTALERVRVVANQGNIAFWVQARAEDAHDDFYAATNALTLFANVRLSQILIVRPTMTITMTISRRSL